MVFYAYLSWVFYVSFFSSKKHQHLTPNSRKYILSYVHTEQPGYNEVADYLFQQL